MDKRKYTNTYDHYDDFMDAHKITGKLFGVIPFWFRVGKIDMAILTAILVLVAQSPFDLNWIGLSIIFLVFVLFSSEYNRVYDLREKVFIECVTCQRTCEDEIERGVPQLEGDPDFIDYEDICACFDEAIFEHGSSSRHIFQKLFGIRPKAK
jgi:hypothetical protein